jgi:ABC-type glycerol-3-phosphate transport system substrate-binding protein
MTIMWSAWVMAIAKVLGEYSGSQPGMECGPMPRGASDGAPGRPTLGAWLLAIPSGVSEDRRKAATEFVLFATRQDELITAADAGNPPPRRSVLKDKKLIRRFRTFPQQLISLENARPRPRTAQWRKAEQALGACLSALYEGSIDGGTALDRSQDALTGIATLGEFSCRKLAAVEKPR